MCVLSWWRIEHTEDQQQTEYESSLLYFICEHEDFMQQSQTSNTPVRILKRCFVFLSSVVWANNIHQLPHSGFKHHASISRCIVGWNCELTNWTFYGLHCTSFNYVQSHRICRIPLTQRKMGIANYIKLVCVCLVAGQRRASYPSAPLSFFSWLNTALVML